MTVGLQIVWATAEQIPLLSRNRAAPRRKAVCLVLWSTAAAAAHDESLCASNARHSLDLAMGIRRRLTLGCRFSALDLFPGTFVKACTAFSSFSATPRRNALRMPALVNTALILCGFLSISFRSFASVAASGCQKPLPKIELANPAPIDVTVSLGAAEN